MHCLPYGWLDANVAREFRPFGAGSVDGHERIKGLWHHAESFHGVPLLSDVLLLHNGRNLGGTAKHVGVLCFVDSA